MLQTNFDLPLSTLLRILGITYDTKLSWNVHIKNICKTARQRMYILRKMKPLVTKTELKSIYHATILNVIEYCGPLFVGMNRKNQEMIEKIRRRCHHIICGFDCHCNILSSVSERRRTQSMKLFNEIKKTNNILHHLLPPQLPRTTHYSMPTCKTNRRLNSFIPFCVNFHNLTLSRTLSTL